MGVVELHSKICLTVIELLQDSQSVGVLLDKMWSWVSLEWTIAGLVLLYLLKLSYFRARFISY